MEHVRTAVVVGGGTAGCTVASVLALRGVRVHVVEAGGEPEHQHERDFFRALHSPGAITTHLVSTTRDAVAHEYTQAAVLGGGSSVNAMVSLRGDAADYDEWASHYDCAGWSWRDVSPEFEGLGMPSYRAQTKEMGRFSHLFVDAIDGAEHAPLAWDSQRVTSASRLLEVKKTTGLVDLHTKASVDSFIDVDGAVIGVALRDGETIESDAVVVTAGALVTPRLVRTLEGSVATDAREHLGKNLQDHPAVMFSCETEVATTDAFTVAAIATLRDPAGRASGQLMAYNHLGQGSSRVGVGVSLLDVHSRGHIDESGAVFFNMLSDERDAANMRGVARRALSVVGSPALASLGEWYADSGGTRCADLVSASDHDLDEWLRRAVGFQSHATGTCRMGASARSGAVSTFGEVHGVSGLWVADASVFPRIPRANTNLPVMMAASRIAQSVAGSLR